MVNILRTNKLHERALRLVYKDSRLTFEGLLEKDDSVTIHHRNLTEACNRNIQIIK